MYHNINQEQTRTKLYVYFLLRGKHPAQRIEQKSRRQTRRGEMKMQEGEEATPVKCCTRESR